MNEPLVAPATAAGLHPLLSRLVAETGASVLDPATFDAWADRPGAAMVVFAEGKEAWSESASTSRDRVLKRARRSGVSVTVPDCWT